jgi:hypothetical protein
MKYAWKNKKTKNAGLLGALSSEEKDEQRGKLGYWVMALGENAECWSACHANNRIVVGTY